MVSHVAIVGAGVVGLSVALNLLQRGYRVTVLERKHVGGESSWAGGGVLSPLLPWEYTEPVTALSLRSMRGYATWVAGLEKLTDCETELWQCGMLVLNVATPLYAHAWCQAHEVPMTPIFCVKEFGWEGARIHKNIFRLPNVAQIRNPRLIKALHTSICHLGGSIQEYCSVMNMNIEGGYVRTIQTAVNKLNADIVVLATGAWAGTVFNTLQATPHIRPIRGQMLLFKLQPGVLNTIVYRNGLYLIPRRDGHILVGSTLEDVGFDKSTDMPTRARLHAQAAELLPTLASVQPIQHWSGLRPGSPDNIPIIGRHPDFDNVFVNTGHYRYGVTMAPASAELLVDLMEGKTPALDPTPYSWEAALARSWGEKL